MMDEALSKSGEWPNVAIMSGTDPQEAMARYGVDAAESHGESSSATQTAEPEQVPAGAGNGPQDGSECADTREKLEADANFNRVVGHCMARGDSLGEAMLHADGYLQSKQESEASEQAIAATLGGGECEQVLTDCNDGLMPPFTAHCSACGAEWGFTPKHCPECGARVTGTRDERKAVKR